MGYRSEVAIALTTDAATLLKELCEYDPGLKELIDDADEILSWTREEIRDNYGTTKIYWSYIKWYEGYSDIDKIENFLANVCDEEWCFIRIGEETEDIEQRGSFWDSDMYVTRGISL